MSDDIIQRKFLRAVGLKVEPQGILFYHDYGEAFFGWDSITHVFAVVLEKDISPNLPLYIVVQKESPTFYYIDGNIISLKYLKTDEESAPDSSRPAPPVKMNKEENLKKVLEGICAHLDTAYIDKPLVTYLRRSQVFLPAFPGFNEISEYCARIIQSVDHDEPKGAQALAEEEEFARASLIPREREELAEGTVLEGRYTVQEIRRGGMGIVYIVFDSENVKFYAMKTFKEEYLWNDKIINQFVREAEIWIKLDHHPNIVKAELVRKIEGKPYIFLEYIQGDTLEEQLLKERLPVLRVLEIGIQFCDAMHYAFRKLGLIHRDIKPSNCFITREGIPKISDFGLGKIFQAASPVEGKAAPAAGHGFDTSISSTTVAGTLPFMAPELFSEHGASCVKTDIYSFGLVLYMMLTGQNPFYDEDAGVVIDRQVNLVPEEPHAVNPEVSVSLSLIVMKCIAKKREVRYDDFSQIHSELIHLYREITGHDYRPPVVREEFDEEDWINKGLSLLSLNRLGEALITFNQALLKNPASAKALMYKGFALMNSGRVSEAIGCLERGLELQSDNWKLWYYKGEAYWKFGDGEGALECYEHALTLTEETAAILGRKGKLLAEMGRTEEAGECLDLSLAQNPRAANIWYEKGLVLLGKKLYTQADECMVKSLALEPRSKWALYYHGLLCLRLGFFTQAVEAEEKVLTIDQDFADAWICIGNCYRETGEHVKAIQACRAACAINPDKAEAYLVQILILKEEGRFEQALEIIESAIELVKKDTALLMEWAECLFLLGYCEDPLVILESVLELEPANERAQLLSSLFKGFAGDRESLFNAIDSISPLESSFCTDLNSLLCFFCDTGAAVSHLESLEPSPELSYLKACLYFIEGRNDAAFAQIDRALSGGASGEKIMRLQSFIKEYMEGARVESAPRKGILGSFFGKKGESLPVKIEEKTPEELLICGMRELIVKNPGDAKRFFQEALSRNQELHAVKFYLGKMLELEGNEENAQLFHTDFINHVPHSLGYWKEKEYLSPGKVEEVYYRWMRQVPGDPATWIEYLCFLSERKNFPKVRLCASKLLDEPPWKEEGARVLCLKGMLQLYLGRVTEARSSFSEALQIDEFAAPAIIGGSLCLQERGNFDEAAMLLLSLKEGALRDYLFSEISWRAHRESESLTSIDRALTQNPASLLLQTQKLKILLGLKRYDEFSGLCNELYTRDIRYAPLKSLRAASLAETGKFHDGIIELSRILQYDRCNMVALKNSGMLYIHLGNFQKAVEKFDECLALSTLDYEVYMGKAMALYYSGDYSSAREFLRKAVRRNYHDADIWQFLAAACFHLGEWPESDTCWNRAIELRSRFVQAWTNRGIFLYHQGKYAEAQEYADRALRISDDYHPAWVCRALCRWKAGDFREATKSIERALSFKSENVKGWVLRGILEFDNKNYLLSLQAFEKAAQIDNKSAVIWFNRALVGVYMKNQPEVRKSLDRAMALNPAMCEMLILRSIFERSFDSEGSAKIFLEKAQKADQEKFDAWRAAVSATEDPMGSLKPLEIKGDPFELPVARPISWIEPVELLHFLAAEKLV